MTRPPGRTDAERWPADHAMADALAAPWMPLAVGMALGVFGVPYLLGWLVQVRPGALVGVALAVVTCIVAARRGADRVRAVARRLGPPALALLALAVAGIPLGGVAVSLLALCGPAGCEDVRDPATNAAVVAVLALAMSTVLSVALAYGVVRVAPRVFGGARRRDPSR